MFTESLTGQEALDHLHQLHHEPLQNPEMEKFILDHDWGIQMISPDQIPDPDSDEIYFNDPFNRIIDIDWDTVRMWRERMRRGSVPPIMMGPDGSIIDGNHRAQAARSMNVAVQALVPMNQDQFVVESSLNQLRKLCGML